MTQSLTEDEFERDYKSRPNVVDEGSVWQFEQASREPINHVWSLIDGEDDKQFAIPGFHTVNVFGYAVTEKPWTDEDIEAVWCDFSEFR